MLSPRQPGGFHRPFLAQSPMALGLAPLSGAGRPTGCRITAVISLQISFQPEMTIQASKIV